MRDAQNIIKHFQAMGGREVCSSREVGKGTCVYVVTVGNTILAVGEGSTARVKSLMPGLTCKKHTKALAVSLWAYAADIMPRFFVLNVKTKDSRRAKSKAKGIEKQLHQTFGSGVTKEEVLDVATRLGLVEKYGVALLMCCDDGDCYRLMVKYTDINKELGSYYSKGRNT